MSNIQESNLAMRDRLIFGDREKSECHSTQLEATFCDLPLANLRQLVDLQLIDPLMQGVSGPTTGYFLSIAESWLSECPGLEVSFDGYLLRDGRGITIDAATYRLDSGLAKGWLFKLLDFVVEFPPESVEYSDYQCVVNWG